MGDEKPIVELVAQGYPSDFLRVGTGALIAGAILAPLVEAPGEIVGALAALALIAIGLTVVASRRRENEAITEKNRQRERLEAAVEAATDSGRADAVRAMEAPFLSESGVEKAIQFSLGERIVALIWNQRSDKHARFSLTMHNGCPFPVTVRVHSFQLEVGRGEGLYPLAHTGAALAFELAPAESVHAAPVKFSLGTDDHIKGLNAYSDSRPLADAAVSFGYQIERDGKVLGTFPQRRVCGYIWINRAGDDD